MLRRERLIPGSDLALKIPTFGYNYIHNWGKEVKKQPLRITKNYPLSLVDGQAAITYEVGTSHSWQIR